MTKNEQLNILFHKWQKKSEDPIKKDGINNEEEFDNAGCKILFIMKEPNDPNKTANDFRDWWATKLEGAFSLRIAEWSLGILEDFPEFDTFNNKKNTKHKAIQKVAFMDVKKVGGTGKSERKTILKYTKEYLALIKEEIKIISPEIVILGLSFWKEISGELFPAIKWEKSGHGVDIAKYEDMKVIDFYHPSSQNAPPASYSLLKDVVQSEAFKNL